MVERVWNKPEIDRIYVELPQNPLRMLNVYVIRSGEYSLIIDTGLNRPECYEALWSGIKELNINLSKAVLFLTHCHSDHIGLAWSLAEKGVSVYMGSLEYKCMEELFDGTSLKRMDIRFYNEGQPWRELEQKTMSGKTSGYAPKLGFAVNLLEDGQKVPCGQMDAVAIYTPGHTPGHMVLYLPQEQILFSGDHILFDITPNIGVWDHSSGTLSDYINSLLKVRNFPIQMAFPAHREIREDVYHRIDELMDHHGERLDEIYQAVKVHPGFSAYQLAGVISWSVKKFGWKNFPPLQKWFAMSETLAHLDYLVEKGHLIRINTKEKIQYYTKKQCKKL